jgi:hypothetical protein
MSLPLWIGLALFVVVDGIVVYTLLKRALAKRAALGGAGFGDLAKFASVTAEETKQYMAANFGGDTGALPGVLQGLVDRLAARAGEQGTTFDRETLKQFAATAVVAIRAARPEDVRGAMEQVR